jgi:oligopeptide transport system substrate-binding protein
MTLLLLSLRVPSRRARSPVKRALLLAGILVLSLILAGSAGWVGSPNAVLLSRPAAAAILAAGPFPTATLPGTPGARAGHYSNPDLGIAFDYPPQWKAKPGTTAETLINVTASAGDAILIALAGSLLDDSTLEATAKQVRDDSARGLTDVQNMDDHALTLKDGRAAWFSEYRGTLDNGTVIRAFMVSTARQGRLVTLACYTPDTRTEYYRGTLLDIFTSVTLTLPQLYGIPRDQALVQLGGESSNPRDYDPATSSGDDLVFSGLVSLNPQLQVTPDLAESWEISPDGTVYTFHLRRNARFHDGRAVVAADVIYSWDRAADPATKSDNVLTYLGDIVGVRERRAGQATAISGLRALDDHTLEVTIDAPKPYFLMKLTYGSTVVVDKANIESGPEWYRTPNGTGPYKLIRWDHFKEMIYERNPDFYLPLPAIRYVILQLYAGVGIRLYETGDVDLSGVGSADVGRVRDPTEPLHADLHEGVNMCTGRVTFDVTQPPFDDPKVRQAFALAIDRQRYIDVALDGVGLPARGLYPPSLPGYNPAVRPLAFDPVLARQRLAESRYGSADALPPIVFTSGGFGSDVGSGLAALIGMWQQNLGVTIQVENLEPDKYSEEIHAGRHGQLLSYSWCADYPDPENFADTLFHSGAEENIGHYANPAVDTLLEQARVESDVPTRMQQYAQAEQLIVDDAASIFLTHSLSYSLVKPQIKGYVWTPIRVPLIRYLSIDPAAMK